ncbi:hypothetical protein HK102_011659, partial [Quaeritorhiza haematococci]
APAPARAVSSSSVSVPTPSIATEPADKEQTVSSNLKPSTKHFFINGYTTTVAPSATPSSWSRQREASSSSSLSSTSSVSSISIDGALPSPPRRGEDASSTTTSMTNNSGSAALSHLFGVGYHNGYENNNNSNDGWDCDRQLQRGGVTGTGIKIKGHERTFSDDTELDSEEDGFDSELEIHPAAPAAVAVDSAFGGGGGGAGGAKEGEEGEGNEDPALSLLNAYRKALALQAEIAAEERDAIDVMEKVVLRFQQQQQQRSGNQPTSKSFEIKSLAGLDESSTFGELNLMKPLPDPTATAPITTSTTTTTTTKGKRTSFQQELQRYHHRRAHQQKLLKQTEALSRLAGRKMEVLRRVRQQ